MQISSEIKTYDHQPIIDLVDIVKERPEDHRVVDLSSLSGTDAEKIARGRLVASRIKAPERLLLIRLILPVAAILYFSLSPVSPLIVPLYGIIGACFFFMLYHLYLYRHPATRPGTQRKIILSANQVDIMVAHLSWMFDPAIPAPMMLLVAVAAIANGFRQGGAAFRAILKLTAVLTPLVILARVQITGVHLSALPFVLLNAFFLIYAYFLIVRMDRLQAAADARTTRLELNNYKLKQLGMALQKSEARYRNLFDDSSVAMVLIEDNMLISLVNEKFLTLTGYTKSDLYNTKKLSDLIYEDDLQRIRRFHAKRRRMGGTTPTEYECKMVDRENNIRHVIIRFNITHWHERIMATIEDITSRKQAKSALQTSIKRLRQTASRLARSQKQYRNLFENTGTATILVEKNMRISMANTKFSELTGFSKKELTGKKRLSEFIERRNLIRIRRFIGKQKEKGLPLPTEYECLMVDRQRNQKHVVMKIYTPPEQESSIVSFFDITKRKKAEAALQDAHERLRILAVMDELTQVANRRQFNDKLASEWQRLLRDGRPLSLIMCDVDCFKAYNDTYGHQNGDRCLRAIADTLSRSVKRSVDLVARYGGEEFAIIMPNTTLSGALRVAETARSAVANLNIPNRASSAEPFITLSLGAASIVPARSVSVDDLIKDADNALYAAKTSGRNQVVGGLTGDNKKGDQRHIRRIP